jgi:hypothetical protein
MPTPCVSLQPYRAAAQESRAPGKIASNKKKGLVFHNRKPKAFAKMKTFGAWLLAACLMQCTSGLSPGWCSYLRGGGPDSGPNMGAVEKTITFPDVAMAKGSVSRFTSWPQTCCHIAIKSQQICVCFEPNLASKSRAKCSEKRGNICSLWQCEVVGTWSQWQTRHKMICNGKGVYETSVLLPPGKHHVSIHVYLISPCNIQNKKIFRSTIINRLEWSQLKFVIEGKTWICSSHMESEVRSP